MQLKTQFPLTNQVLSASLQDIATFDVAQIDVLHLDIENTGSAAFTDFRVLARVSEAAPWRDITPASLMVEGDLVFAAARTVLAKLAAGNWAHLGLNVTDYQGVKLQAMGAGGASKVTAGGYEVKP